MHLRVNVAFELGDGCQRKRTEANPDIQIVNVKNERMERK